MNLIGWHLLKKKIIFVFRYIPSEPQNVIVKPGRSEIVNFILLPDPEQEGNFKNSFYKIIPTYNRFPPVQSYVSALYDEE